MDVGGVEKALLGVLSALPLDQIDVTVGLLHHKGGFLDFLPKEIKVIDVTCYDKYRSLINDPPLTSVKKYLSDGNIIDALVHFVLYIQRKINGNHYWFYKYFMQKESVLSNEIYDVAVSFAGPSQMMDYYICRKVKAHKKCCWIHFDVSRFGIDRGMTNRLYKDFDEIFIVSEAAKKVFDRMFPRFCHKTVVFHNIISPQAIKMLSERGETFDDEFGGKRILTVGRISKEKGCEEALEALSMLLDRGYNVKWYFVGGGKDIQLCNTIVSQKHLQDNVLFLGVRTNPYTYMRDCDIYVQPSRHEGYCITLAEALFFENPIVVTDFTGAREQLVGRENGIVSGMPPSDLCAAIIKALSYEKVSGKVLYDNDINKFIQLL